MFSTRRSNAICLPAAAACLLLLLAPAAFAGDAADEAGIMNDVRSLLRREAPGWAHRMPGWRAGDASHHCSWTGVLCKAGHVTELRMTLENHHELISEPAWRDGTPQAHPVHVPAEVAHLGALPRLKMLILRWPGAPWGAALAPQWLRPGSFPSLEWMDLTVDMLPGALPLPDIQPGALPSLRGLVLAYPNLTSTLPASWGSDPAVLPALEELRVVLGNTPGGLPPGWAAGGFRRLANIVLTSLQGFHQRYRVPTAQRAAAAAAASAAADATPPSSLPAAWGGGAFPALQSLTVSGMHIVGSLPASWTTPGAFPALDQLRMWQMDLSGPLPERLFQASPRLTSVVLSDCLFSGTLPARWGNSSAAIISLERNILSGPAFPPAWLEGSMPGLLDLQLSGNTQLTGTLPPSLPWPLLRTLAVDSTGVSGSVPATWCNQPLKLTDLYAGNTSVDPAWPHCKQLENFRVLMRANGEPVRSENETERFLQHWRAPGQPWSLAARVGLGAALPLGALMAAGFAARLLLQRRRQRRLQQGLERQRLLQADAQPWHAHAATAPATSSGGALHELPYEQHAPSTSSMLVRAAPRRRLVALLTAQLAEGGQLAVELAPAAAALPRAITHRMSPSEAPSGMDERRASSVELSSLGRMPGAQSTHAVQLWLAGSSNAGEPLPTEVAGGSALPSFGSSSNGQPAGSVAPSARLPSLPWGLPTDLMCMPASAITFVLGKHGELVEVGSGTHATVFLARLRRQGEEPLSAQPLLVAVKVFEVEAGVNSAAIWREVAMLRQCQHPCVVQLLGVTLKGPLLMIAMELKSGSLRAALDGSKPLGDLRWAARGRRIALDVAEGLHHLHTRLGIMHSDLKPANVLLSGDGRACLSDLGLAQALGTGVRTAAGFSRLYAAPEQLMGQRCGLPADVYSFGLLLVSLLTRQLVRERGAWRLPRAPEECPREVVALVEECLSADPAARPTADQILARLQAAAG
ncbi:hypothetical protein ABPG75_002584 [Micractinium tetrahymenae]